MSSNKPSQEDKEAKPPAVSNKEGAKPESFAYPDRGAPPHAEHPYPSWRDMNAENRGNSQHVVPRYAGYPPNRSSRHPGSSQKQSTSGWQEYLPPPYADYGYAPNPYYRYRESYEHPPWGEQPTYYEDMPYGASPRSPSHMDGHPPHRSWPDDAGVGYESQQPYAVSPGRYNASLRRESSSQELSPWPRAETPTRSNRNHHPKPRASRRLEWEGRASRPPTAAWGHHSFDEGDDPGAPHPSSFPIAGTEEDRRGQHHYPHPHFFEEKPPPKEYIREIGPYDVLCGRGVPNKLGPGNRYFRDLVRKDQLEYISCRRAEKPPIATKIIGIIRSHGGRFLRRMKIEGSGETYGWIELAENRVYEKVCQALRDGAPQIRQRMLELDAQKLLKEEPKTPDKENQENQHQQSEEV